MKLKFKVKHRYVGIDPSTKDNNAFAIVNKEGGLVVMLIDKDWFIYTVDKLCTKPTSFEVNTKLHTLFIEDYENRNAINEYSNNPINEIIGQVKQICYYSDVNFKKIKASVHKFLFRQCKTKHERILKLRKYVIISIEEEKDLTNHEIDALSILIWGIKNE